MSAPTERDLLARARAGMTPSRADKVRMRRRLVAAVGAASVAGASATASAATAGTSAIGATSLSFKLVVLIASASVLGGVGYWMSDAESERPIERLEAAATAPAPATPAPAPVSPPPEPPSVDEASTGLAEERDLPTGHPPGPRTRPSESPPTLPADTLAEETALIRRARASMRSEDWTTALSALDEHARRFPSGLLAEERDVQRVRVHCAVGDVATAEAAARRFLHAHPSSLHAGAMANPCAEGR